MVHGAHGWTDNIINGCVSRGAAALNWQGRPWDPILKFWPQEHRCRKQIGTAKLAVIQMISALRKMPEHKEDAWSTGWNTSLSACICFLVVLFLFSHYYLLVNTVSITIIISAGRQMHGVWLYWKKQQLCFRDKFCYVCHVNHIENAYSFIHVNQQQIQIVNIAILSRTHNYSIF